MMEACIQLGRAGVAIEINRITQSSLLILLADQWKGSCQRMNLVYDKAQKIMHESYSDDYTKSDPSSVYLLL